MLYIIYDLEFTVARRQEHLSEIIEIGAAKVADVNGTLQVVDLFQTYVRPGKNPRLTRATMEFTGVRQENVDSAPIFRDAAQQFLAWIDTDEYYLCAWGPDDKVQLVRHCREAKMEPDWIKNHNDLQVQFSRSRAAETFRQIGLKAALELTEIAFEGTQHRALDDAYNTARLFIRFFEEFELQENTPADDAAYSSEVIFSTGDEAFLPFQKLAQLMRPNARTSADS